MDSKIDFALDFLHVVRSLELKSSEDKYFVVEALTKLFLVEWGFEYEEIEKIDKIFWDNIHNGKAPELEEPIGRLVNKFQINNHLAELFITQMITISMMDDDVSAEEGEFIRMLKNAFDFRESEFFKFVNKASHSAFALQKLGDAFIKESKML